MKNKNTTREKASLKMLLVYFALVLSLIITAFIFRAISVINNSRFDGENRFTVAVAHEGRVKGIISFEPSTTSLSVLKINPGLNVRVEKMNISLGIIPDGYIVSNSEPDLDDSVPALMQSLFWQLNAQRKNITSYDIFQMWLYSTRIPRSTINIREIDAGVSRLDLDKYIVLLFPDEKLTAENLSLQIVNAAGVTGLGTRLERILSNMGGNIVSIQTAPDIKSNSVITYYDQDSSYTLNKLSNLLPFKLEKMSKRGIADIIITVGEDSKKTNIF